MVSQRACAARAPLERARRRGLVRRRTAGRRGRRPLRASAKRRRQYRGKQMRARKLPAIPLGSPGRGAVAARSAVTEGLVPTLVRRNHVIRQPAPGGRRRRAPHGERPAQPSLIYNPSAANRGRRCSKRLQLRDENLGIAPAQLQRKRCAPPGKLQSAFPFGVRDAFFGQDQRKRPGYVKKLLRT